MLAAWCSSASLTAVGSAWIVGLSPAIIILELQVVVGLQSGASERRPWLIRFES
jgi:hypothetical protein